MVMETTRPHEVDPAIVRGTTASPSPAVRQPLKAWAKNRSGEYAHTSGWHPQALNTLSPSDLCPGKQIVVIKQDQSLAGTIDCISDDGSVFWMWRDDGGERMLIHEEDDVLVLLHSTSTEDPYQVQSIS
jgi:hypothetical protein